jgi:GNAT superfamily N-acetyltransferase
VNEDFSRLVETNLAEWVMAKASCLPDVEVHREADVCWTFTRACLPENTAMLARFSSTSALDRVCGILSKSLEQKSACTWISGPSSASLAPALRRAGFHCRIHCAGMICCLSEVAERVSDVPRLRIGEMAQCPSLAPVTTDRRRRAQAIRHALAIAQPRRTWHFCATLEDQPVGHATLFVGAGTAGIYDVEVSRHARKRGIGTALVHAALLHARNLGHAHAVLAATGAGFNVYAGLGFREVTTISFWRFGKMRQSR